MGVKRTEWIRMVLCERRCADPIFFQIIKLLFRTLAVDLRQIQSNEPIRNDISNMSSSGQNCAVFECQTEQNAIKPGILGDKIIRF